MGLYCTNYPHNLHVGSAVQVVILVNAMSLPDSSAFRVKVFQQGTYYELYAGSLPMTAPAVFTATFTPTDPQDTMLILAIGWQRIFDTVHSQMPYNYWFTMSNISVNVDTVELHPVVSRVCAENKYMYGYNGQIRTDEWAGQQNHYNALFWEYDPRTGRRANQDPKGNEWESSFGTFGGNPIWHNDINGDSWVPVDKSGNQVALKDPNIVSYKWVDYDKDANGNNVPKPGSIETAYTFGIYGMTTLSSEGYKPHQKWQSYDDLSTGDNTADKNIASLDPRVRNDMKKLILTGRLRYGIDIRGAGQGGYRTYAEQDALYAKGRRGIPGEKKVTNARGGFGNHNFGLAMDVAIFENNKYLIKGTEWQYGFMGQIGQTQIGLTWGGNQDWVNLGMFDPAHYQNTFGYSMSQLRKLPKDSNGYIISK